MLTKLVIILIIINIVNIPPARRNCRLPHDLRHTWWLCPRWWVRTISIVIDNISRTRTPARVKEIFLRVGSTPDFGGFFARKSLRTNKIKRFSFCRVIHDFCTFSSGKPRFFLVNSRTKNGACGTECNGPHRCDPEPQTPRATGCNRWLWLTLTHSEE